MRRRDGLQALLLLLEMGGGENRSTVATSLPFWQLLNELARVGSYDVKGDLAALLSRCLPALLAFLTPETAEQARQPLPSPLSIPLIPSLPSSSLSSRLQVVELGAELVAVLDGEPLLRVLQAMGGLLRFALSRSLPLNRLPLLHEKAEFLAMHPNTQLAREANGLEQLLLSLLRQQGGDFDEYH